VSDEQVQIGRPPVFFDETLKHRGFQPIIRAAPASMRRAVTQSGRVTAQ
jgi:hypothetical protein